MYAILMVHLTMPIYIAQEGWAGSSVCVCLCVSQSVRTACTAVTHSINFVTKPCADAPARCTVERESNATHTIYI